jgi:predicted O-methyltransferase YrrM
LTRNAKRVLAIGIPLSDLSVETLLAEDGLLIVMEPERARAEAARRLLAAAGLDSRATVIAGDPQRMLYKLSGPFDLIVCAPEYMSVRSLAERLLTPDGVLITNA